MLSARCSCDGFVSVETHTLRRSALNSFALRVRNGRGVFDFTTMTRVILIDRRMCKRGKMVAEATGNNVS